MPNIKSVSDLKNYAEILQDVTFGNPVFLTKNNEIKYIVVDIEEYEKTKAILKLMDELSKGEQSVKEKDWTELSEVEKMLGIIN